MGRLALVKRESLARHRTAQQCQILTQKGWPDAPESVTGSDWNGWPDQIGIPGRMSPECAVRGDLTLLCNLHVLFLRRDYPGAGLISAGDIDNRIKTLVDGLTKPLGSGQLGGLQPEAGEDPFFCLLESDSLVNSLTVETDALLSPPRNGDGSSNWVRLVITVELRPYHVTPFNLGFA